MHIFSAGKFQLFLMGDVSSMLAAKINVSNLHGLLTRRINHMHKVKRRTALNNIHGFLFKSYST